MIRMLLDIIIGKVTIVEQKMFYKQPLPTPASDLNWEQYALRRKEIYKQHNFDCPEAVDWVKFEEALVTLLDGKDYLAPSFDDRKCIR